MKTLKKVLALQGALMLLLSVLGLFKRNKVLKSREAFLLGTMGLIFLELAGLIKTEAKNTKKRKGT